MGEPFFVRATGEAGSRVCCMESSVADRKAVLSKRSGDILFLALLTLLIAGVVALVLCIAWFGLDGRTISRWARGMTLGWIAAFPTALLLSGSLRRVTSRFVGVEPPRAYAGFMRESELLANIAARSAGLAAAFAQVAVGPGDDCAVVRIGTSELLLTVDQVIAGRHFTNGTAIDLIARKAIARSISDIAAMAGTPVCALATGALPPGFSQADADALFASMKKWAEHWKCPLVGGDLATLGKHSEPMVLTVTVVGVPHEVRGAVLRSGAKVGDGVYVTGALGGSFDGTTGLGKHLTFEPRVFEARQLADALGHDLHAMMDISDGLGRDAGRLARASGVRIQIESGKIPKTPGVSDWKRAAGEGEDYELVFTATGNVASTIGGVPITRIGSVVPGDGCVVLDGTQLIDAAELGWEH